jgi:hypothetical protein
MPSESARRSAMLSLPQLVSRYLEIAGEFGLPVPLTAFSLSRDETERLFSGYDEDYHISRFFHFSEADGMTYDINGEGVTHVALDPDIQSIL